MTEDTVPDPTALPPRVTSALVRGLGAYLRASPRAELPAEFRRFAGFRQQALQRHRAPLLAALERPEPRARVLEWLADGQRLEGNDASLLREVCERRNGWRERLLVSDDVPTKEKPPPDRSARLEEALERERERSRHAREDERRTRAEARLNLESERSKGTALARELGAARRELERLERKLRDVEAAAIRAASEAERKLRRAERERDRARATSESLRSELKRERKKATDPAAATAEAPRQGGRSERAQPPRRRTGPPRRRARLRIPPGRLPDDVDTLDEWLEREGVRLLVDGYNVTKAPGGFGELDLPRQRDRLVDEVERLARRRGVSAIIVFDGSNVPPGISRRHRGVAEVHYSRPQETADDHLVAVLRDLPPEPVVVVTSDRGLQERVRALGASVASARQLLGLIR
jgi:predicted RNA-binding protein with PIN domain